jgi:hypothetical protein
VDGHVILKKERDLSDLPGCDVVEELGKERPSWNDHNLLPIEGGT